MGEGDRKRPSHLVLALQGRLHQQGHRAALGLVQPGAPEQRAQQHDHKDEAVPGDPTDTAVVV